MNWSSKWTLWQRERDGGGGHGSQVCKELDTTERLNWTELNWMPNFLKFFQIFVNMYYNLLYCNIYCNTLATWCEELTHWKRPWCWGRLKVGREAYDIGWDGWMASLTQWTWFWVNSRSWWRTRRPGVLQSMGSQRVRHNWATELKSSLEDIYFNLLFLIELSSYYKETFRKNTL